MMQVTSSVEQFSVSLHFLLYSLEPISRYLGHFFFVILHVD